MTINNKNYMYNAPKIWGIVNSTPDSFSDGGLFIRAENAYTHIEKLIADKANYIDIGAASSRPNAPFISEEEEWNRLRPLFEIIEEKNPSLFSRISVDTWRAGVAKKVLEKNVFCINDISAFQWDESLLDVLLEYKPYYVLMHCRGTPKTMQENTQYKDIVEDVYSFFEERISLLDKLGFPKEKIILDLGIGFGKSLKQNFELLNAADHFLKLGLPLMAAVSRKSCLRDLLSLERTDISKLDEASANASLLLAQKGFIHHRVHNARAVSQAFCLMQNLEGVLA